MGTAMSGGAAAPGTIPLGLFGAGVGAHGLDQVWSGLRTVWTGSNQRPYAAQGLDFVTGNPAASDWINGVAGMLATAGAGMATRSVTGAAGVTRSLASPPVNPVPETFARVVPGNLSPRSLGVTDRVFVTDAAMLRGLSPAQIALKLEIPAQKSFQVIEFSTHGIDGIATPIRNLSPGFTGRGVTSGGLPEWTIPNGSLPPNSRMWRAQ
jgi:hypothetical protein